MASNEDSREIIEMRAKMDALDKTQAIIEFDLDGNVLNANENFLKALGYNLSEIQGKHHRMFVPPAEAKSTEYASFWSRLSSGESFRGEFQRIRSDGCPIWINASYNPLRDTDGSLFKVVKYAADITEAKAAEALGKRAADAMENAATNLMIADADFNLVYTNQRSQETLKNLSSTLQNEFGLSVQELLGGSIDRFHKNPASQRTLLKNLGSRKHEQRIKLGERTLFLSVGALQDDEGEFSGAVVNWEDITEKVEAEENERQAAEELRGKVHEILNVVNAAAQGDLTKEIVVLGEDPIGQMGEGLRSMIKELSNIIVQIQEASDQFGNSAKSISDASNNLAESSQTQAATVEEMSASVGELTGSIDVIAKNARDANEVANNTVAEAEEGGKAVDRSIQAMKEINQSSEQISEIIQVISEIASQTNLLALNAAIEAARAGEHGLGFAVVADEVRKLAERSSEAAKQITGLIRESTQRVADGAKLSEQTGAALKQIIDGVDRTAKAIAEIASATDEQSATAGEVSRGIQNVSSITENNSASSEEMASSSEQLAAQAVAMRELVRHFQI